MEEKLIMPGEEVELTRTAEVYERHHQWIAESGGVTDLSCVELSNTAAVFEDGTTGRGYPPVVSTPPDARRP